MSKTESILKANIQITGLDELQDILSKMVELASQLKKLEIAVRTGLPQGSEKEGRP